MRAVSEEMITLLGTLDFCMAKRNNIELWDDRERSPEAEQRVQIFKAYLSTLTPQEREAILDELQRYVWLHDIA